LAGEIRKASEWLTCRRTGRPGSLGRAASLRSLTDEGLAQQLEGWKEGTGNWWLAQMEFKRRQAAGNVRRGWIGVVLSIVAIIVSVASQGLSP